MTFARTNNVPVRHVTELFGKRKEKMDLTADPN